MTQLPHQNPNSQNLELAKSIVDLLEGTESLLRNWLTIVETARARAICAIAVVANSEATES